MNRSDDICAAIKWNLIIDTVTYITRGWLLTVAMVLIFTLIILEVRQAERRKKRDEWPDIPNIGKPDVNWFRV